MAKLSTLLGPLLIFGFYLGFTIIIRNKIPDTLTFINQIKELYGAYGYSLVFFGALLEALLFIGFYIPGSTVVLLGAALAKTGVVSYPLVFILGILGLLLGNIINYFLGKHGWYRIFISFGFQKGIDIAKEKLKKHEKKAIFFGFIFPGSASFISTACGILGMSFRIFVLYSFLSLVFWSMVWGNLAYFFGFIAIQLLMKYFGIFLLMVLIIWGIKKILKIKFTI